MTGPDQICQIRYLGICGFCISVLVGPTKAYMTEEFLGLDVTLQLHSGLQITGKVAEIEPLTHHLTLKDGNDPSGKKAYRIDLSEGNP